MDWARQGCDVCRSAWERGIPRDALSLLGVSDELHVRLHRCRSCGAYWEELERYASHIPDGEAADLISNPSFVAYPQKPMR